MSLTTAQPGRGFSLLEATIALAILAIAAVVCLEVRAQGIVRARAMQEARVVEQKLRTILELAEAGLLEGAAESGQDDVAHRRVWRGVEGGDPWECVSEIVEESNPSRSVLAGAAASQAPASLRVERTTVTLRGRTAVSMRAVRQ